MNYATIKYYDIANGPGVRVSLYVSGCRNHCKGCFNHETWDFAYGNPFTPEVEEQIFKGMEPSFIKGFSLLGGDPFEPENQLALVGFMERLRKKFPDKSVWAWTGYGFETDLLAGKKGDPEVTMRLLNCIDVLVDGRFLEELKNPDLLFRGSANQRMILVKQSLESDELTELVFETGNFYIRKFVKSDLAALTKIMAEAKPMSGIYAPFNAAQTEEFLRDVCIGEGAAFAVQSKADGGLKGCVLLKPVGEKMFRTGWFFLSGMDEEEVYEAVSAVHTHAFTECAAVKISAVCTGDDEAAMAKKLDMKFEGVEHGDNAEGTPEWHIYSVKRGNK